jgi:arylsulfatase
MHVTTHLSPKYEAMRNSKNGWTIQEAGMAQLDDIVGSVMQYLKDNGLDDNTIIVFTSDNGTQTFTWPDGGLTPFAQCKGTVMEGGFRVPCILRWPGHVPADSIQNGIFSGLDWFPTFLAVCPPATKSSTLLKAISARCGLTTSSIGSLTSPVAGWELRTTRTYRLSQTCVSIRLSALAGRQTSVKAGRRTT